MKRNSKSHKIIQLADRQAYNSFVKSMHSSLNEINTELKEYGLNLLANSSHSEWNRSKKIGDREKISDDVLLESNDKIVMKLNDISQAIDELIYKITDDNDQ